MKIAILCNTSWNIFNFRMNLIKALQEKGHEITLLAPKDEYTDSIKKKGILFEEVKMNIKGQNPFQDARLILTYRTIFKRIDPDLLLTYTIKPTIYGNIAARFGNSKVISNVTGLGTIFIKPSFATFVAATLYKIAFKKCHKVFFQNKTDYRFFRKKGFVKPLQCDIVPGSGIDVRKFKVDTRSFDKSLLKILFVGRVIRDKGVVEFLEAAKEVKSNNPNTAFYVVGKIGYENKTALSLGEFQSYVDQGIVNHIEHTDDMIGIYKEMDIMVLPSYREGMSRALLEAASMKMPIIATDVPGCREIVTQGVNGYLVKVKSIEDLTDKLRRMLSLSEDQLVKMGLESRALVEKEFSEHLVIEKYLEAISSVFFEKN